MGYFQVRYDSRVIIYERKLFIRLVTDETWGKAFVCNNLAPLIKQEIYNL